MSQKSTLNKIIDCLSEGEAIANRLGPNSDKEDTIREATLLCEKLGELENLGSIYYEEIENK